MSKEFDTLDALFKSLQLKYKDATSIEIEKAYGEAADANDKKQYIVDSAAREALKFFVNGEFQKIVKPITSAKTFAGLCDLINGDGEITLNGNQLIYIAELYSQITYQTIEEAKTLIGKHESFTDMYTEQYEDQMNLKFISQIAKHRASEEMMSGIDKEAEIEEAAQIAGDGPVAEMKIVGNGEPEAIEEAAPENEEPK